jgi:hypothetical protein
MKPQVQNTGDSQEHSAQGNLSRRAFTHGSVASLAAAALAAGPAKAQQRQTVVDDFDRSDSFYHGDGWQSLNPGYWKIEGHALRRRLHTRGDKARATGFPFHRFMETEYGTRPPYGMIWRRDWPLSGNYFITVEASVRALPGDDPEPDYSLIGICFGGRTLYESWNGAAKREDACWYAAWRGDGTFGVFSHSSDETLKVQPDSSRPAGRPEVGEQVRIDLEVAGAPSGPATVTARLIRKSGESIVTCTNVDRESFLNGHFGVAARGSLDFEINEVRLDPADNRPTDAPVNELHVCYPLGDSLREVDGQWHCKFITLFRQEGRRAEIRIAHTESPALGWQAVNIAGRAGIITNGFRRATAVIDCVLPGNPADATFYYTVWKDGTNVTADPRPELKPEAQRYVGRLPQLKAPYRLCGLSCHAINGRKPGLDRTDKFQENWIHDQPLPDAYEHLDDYGFQVMLWEDDIWYLELVLYPPSTDDAYKIITTTIAGPTTRRQMMRHWNVLNPGDHDHGMDDVKGPEQLAVRNRHDLGQDPVYMQRNFEIVQHLISGDDSPSGTANPKRWRRWKMPGGDFSLLILDARLWRSSQDTHIWATEGWGDHGHVYDRKDPTRSLLGEEQFAWLQETVRTETAPLVCVTGLNGLHTVWQPSAEAEQRNRVSADYAGWVKAGSDRAIELLSSRDGIVSVYGDVHIGSILKNRDARLYECSFGPIGRTGGRRVKDGFGGLMKDYDGRDLNFIALFQQDYESPGLKQQSSPGYWDFLEMVFDPTIRDPRIQLRVRRLNDAPRHEPRGGGAVDVAASSTGRLPSCRLPETKTLAFADVRLARPDGRPIRGVRSLANGSVPIAGLVDVAPGTEILMTAHDGARIEARTIRTLPPA